MKKESEQTQIARFNSDFGYGPGARYDIFESSDEDEENDDESDDELPEIPDNVGPEEKLVWKARREVLKECDDEDNLSDIVEEVVQKYGIRYNASGVYNYCLSEFR